jgi:hypothetical protein
MPPFYKHEYKLQNLKNHYHFKAQTIIPACQGIEEIGGDGDLNRHITVTLPSPHWTPLKTPFGSCKQPLKRSRRRWPHCVRRGMRRRIVLVFGRETCRFSTEIIVVYKPPWVGWHCDLLIYRQGFGRIIQSFKFGRCQLVNRRAKNSMLDARIPYVTNITILRIFYFF